MRHAPPNSSLRKYHEHTAATACAVKPDPTQQRTVDLVGSSCDSPRHVCSQARGAVRRGGRVGVRRQEQLGALYGRAERSCEDAATLAGGWFIMESELMWRRRGGHRHRQQKTQTAALPQHRRTSRLGAVSRNQAAIALCSTVHTPGATPRKAAARDMPPLYCEQQLLCVTSHARRIQSNRFMQNKYDQRKSLIKVCTVNSTPTLYSRPLLSAVQRSPLCALMSV